MAAEARAWEGLPSTALVSIFRKLCVEDRFTGGPLVCRTWKEASRNPLCWESMLPEGESPEFYFIKHSGRRFYDDDCNTMFRRLGVEDRLEGAGQARPLHRAPRISLHGFRSFVDRSQGCAATIYLPFGLWMPESKDAVLFLAERCPKLKHLSFNHSWPQPEPDFLVLIRSCKDLDLLDVGDGFELSSAMMQEMGRCCPGLCGLRYAHAPRIGDGFGSIFACSFPQLQLLNLEFTKLDNASFSTILKGCTQLRYMAVNGCGLDIRTLDQPEVAELVGKIPEFWFDRVQYDSVPGDRHFMHFDGLSDAVDNHHVYFDDADHLDQHVESWNTDTYENNVDDLEYSYYSNADKYEDLADDLRYFGSCNNDKCNPVADELRYFDFSTTDKYGDLAGDLQCFDSCNTSEYGDVAEDLLYFGL